MTHLAVLEPRLLLASIIINQSNGRYGTRAQGLAGVYAAKLYRLCTTLQDTPT